ncbi:MAG: tryptophan 2,3-dioxygenase [Methylococcaceae bacterium]|nr:tryptophan 2,3-dioxygenase [Methylococcaceae bacterium]
MNKEKQPLCYSEYLKLPTLLNAQVLESAKHGHESHDEMLFIITHQTYELWFKQILHELYSVLELFSALPLDEKKLNTIATRLQRIIKIQFVINQQISILETMTSLDFLDFRDFLIPASGFQSIQFREIELRLGLSHHLSSYSYGRFTDEDKTYLENVAQQVSLFELLDAWLARMPFLEFREFSFWDSYGTAVKIMLDNDSCIIQNNPLLSGSEKKLQTQELETTRQSFNCLFNEDLYQQYKQEGHFKLTHNATLAALFIRLYRDEPLLQLPFKILNKLMDIDAQLTSWRSNHYLMVQRMLGTKIGTGGSSGHEYLKSTINGKRIYADLFNLSTYLIPRSKLPTLPESLVRNLGFYQQRH